MAEVELLEDRTQLTPMTYAATDLPLQLLPDGFGSNVTAVSAIYVADDFVVQDVNVQLNIEFPHDEFLNVVLIAPDGTRVPLFRGIGGANDNFTDLMLDHQAAQLIVDGAAAFTGSFQPSGDLSLLNGQHAQGDWQLELVYDFFHGYFSSGTLQSWSLMLDDTPPEVGNTLDTAATVTRVSTFGIIDTPTDVDLFAVDLPADMSITARLEFLSASNLQGFLRVFDVTGNVVDTSVAVTDANEPQVTFTSTNAGRYFIGVSGVGNATYDPVSGSSTASSTAGSYSLRFVSDDTVGDTIATAQLVDLPLLSSASISSFLNGPVDVDLFAVDLREGESVSADVTSPNFSAYLHLRGFDAQGHRIGYGFFINQFVAPAEGRYFVGVSIYPNEEYDPLMSSPLATFVEATEYTLRLKRQDAILDTVYTAQLLKISSNYPVALSSSIETSNDVDLFAIELRAGQTLRFDVDAGSAANPLEPEIRVFTGSYYGEEIATRRTEVSGKVEVVLSAAFDGWYYIGVSSAPGAFGVPYDPFPLGNLQGSSTDTYQGSSAGPYTVHASVSYVDLLQPTPNPGLYSLKVAHTGAFSVLLSAPDGSRFVGKVSLLTSDQRLLTEQVFRDESGVMPVTFTAVVAPDTYLLRIQSGSSATAALALFRTDFVIGSDPRLRFPVGLGLGIGQAVDVNRDGRVDLVKPNEASNDVHDVSVLLGRGDGTFEEQVLFAVGETPFELQTADVNGDGVVDLITSNYSSKDVSVLLGRGDGTFEDQSRYFVGDNQRSLLAVDVNGDGRIDLIASNNVSGDVSVLLGRGDGTFEDQRIFDVGDDPIVAQQVVDVNDDGRMDLVTLYVPESDEILSQNFEFRVSVLLGRRDGAFEVASRFAVGDAPQRMLVLDVNGDGRVDLVTSDGDSGDVSVRLGRGDGTFEVERRVDLGDSPADLHFFALAVDVNGDDRIDLVTTNLSNDVSVLLGREDGTFEDQRRFAVGDVPQAVHAVDVNGDGDVDLVVETLQSDDFEPGSGNPSVPSSLTVLLGRGDGTFEFQHRVTLFGRTDELRLLDVNGDGRVDLVTKRNDLYDEPSVSVLLGRGDGTFEDQRRDGVGLSPEMVKVVDVNGDGRIDLVTPNSGSNDVSILLGRGDGTFEDQHRFAVGNSPGSMQVVDLNGDGRVDIVTRNFDNDFYREGGEHFFEISVSVLLGRGDGTFEEQLRFAFGTFASGNGFSLQVVDANGDGRVDLVMGNSSSGGGSVLRGRGDGTFEDPRLLDLGILPETVPVDASFGLLPGTVQVDVNGDGRIDRVTPNRSSGDVSVLLGNAQGDFVNALSISPIAVGARPLVEDINGDGIDDVLVLRQDGAVLYRQGTRGLLNGTGQSVATSLGEFGTAVVLNPEHLARDFTLLRSPSSLRIAILDVSGSAVSLYQWEASQSTSATTKK